MRKVINWIMRKVGIGEVVQDYGNLVDERDGPVRTRTTVILCRAQGKSHLVFRQEESGFLGGGNNYMKIAITQSTLERLADIIVDARKRIDADCVSSTFRDNVI